ncbi:MAG: globin, partial [Chloroflexota bacterium]
MFYAKVEADETLRSIFPEDLEPGKKWQCLFLSQYWGGPTTYSAER